MAIRKPTIDRPKTGDLYDLFNAALSGQSVKFAPGSIVKGRISAIKGSDVFVNIGYKSEGTVSTTEFKDPEAIQVGAEIDVFLQNLEDEKTGMVAISKRMADEKIRWEAIIGKYAEGAIVRGAITGKVRGGLTVKIEEE